MQKITARKEAEEKEVVEALILRVLRSPNFKPTDWVKAAYIKNLLLAAAAEHGMPVGRWAGGRVNEFGRFILSNEPEYRVRFGLRSNRILSLKYQTPVRLYKLAGGRES